MRRFSEGSAWSITASADSGGVVTDTSCSGRTVADSALSEEVYAAHTHSMAVATTVSTVDSGMISETTGQEL